ncbi:hypothetical protein [Algoriphagus limi]|uniref:Positive regulator of sigma(E), RseC/MucC n=1 Tax=Algoriphagus limi TaxID=2975273 RepID=A0ABT2GAC4_9BACT|nr:hypothetical protein [Algoriphagus limi]MCS5490882.1 hypothetical protein [Algoriphagus limi]
MNLIPFYTETLVSALSKEEVMEHISRKTREVNFLDKNQLSNQAGIAFNGIVGNQSFRLSKVIQRSNTFLPLILGEVEDTPRGSIIFLRYKLFPGALFFVLFWTIVLVGFSAYYLGISQEYLNGGICLGLAFINYFLAVFLFHRQVNQSRKDFHQIINYQLKD